MKIRERHADVGATFEDLGAGGNGALYESARTDLVKHDLKGGPVAELHFLPKDAGRAALRATRQQSEVVCQYSLCSVPARTALAPQVCRRSTDSCMGKR